MAASTPPSPPLPRRSGRRRPAAAAVPQQGRRPPRGPGRRGRPNARAALDARKAELIASCSLSLRERAGVREARGPNPARLGPRLRSFLNRISSLPPPSPQPSPGGKRKQAAFRFRPTFACASVPATRPGASR